jgi:hypothetical protein
VEYTTGEAQRLIVGCQQLNPDEGFARALELLATNFGNPTKISKCLMKSLLDGPKIQARDTAALNTLSRDLQEAEITLRSIGYLADINAVSNLRRIADRLPPSLRNKWKYKAFDIAKSQPKVLSNSQFAFHKATFADLSAFIFEEAQVAASEYGDEEDDASPRFKDRKRAALTTQASSASVSMATTLNSNSAPAHEPPVCCVCNKQHPLYRCEAFIKMTLSDRYKAIKESNRCFNCFRAHSIKDGESRGRCKHAAAQTFLCCTIQIGSQRTPIRSQQPTRRRQPSNKPSA